MKIEDVKRLTPRERFFYWIKERHKIFLRRQDGKPKPWTDDEVLQSVFFTNPYRENDKVTQWFRQHIRQPLRDDPAVIFATVAFRWFNLTSTALVLMGTRNATYDVVEPQYKLDNLLKEWDKEAAIGRLSEIRKKGEQIFTGAYMINSPPGKPKLEAICERIDNVWKDRERLLKLDQGCSMELFHSALMKYPGLAGFMAYEVVCDLRYTYVLENAPDKMTWCNPGPGAIRGLYRVLGRPFQKGNNAATPPVPKDWQEQTQKLLQEAERNLSTMPPFEMREIEMSLCETDKYERILWGDGKAKRLYQGV